MLLSIFHVIQGNSGETATSKMERAPKNHRPCTTSRGIVRKPYAEDALARQQPFALVAKPCDINAVSNLVLTSLAHACWVDVQEVHADLSQALNGANCSGKRREHERFDSRPAKETTHSLTHELMSSANA